MAFEGPFLKFPENLRSEIWEPWEITVAPIFYVADYQMLENQAIIIIDLLIKISLYGPLPFVVA